MGATRNTQLAEKELEKYSEPTSHEYYYAKGTICLMKKEYKEAIPYFERALRIFPFFQQAWLNLGCALIKTISISNAYDALQIALLLSEPGKNTYDVAKENLDDLEDSIRHVNNVSLDVFIKRMKKFEKHFREMKTDTAAAARGFEELLTEDPNHVQTHGNLGLCYAMLGRKADAEKELKKALELDPKYTVASHNLQLLDNVTEGQSINSIPDCQQIEIDFYKDLFTMQNSKNTSETKIIRELYRLCGLLQE